MNNPEYVKVGDKKYKINTDFRVAIECDAISRDENIGDYERALAIIYLLFGDEGLNDTENYNQLLMLGRKYLNCGKEYEPSNEKPDMDFKQDLEYIEASFMSDYQIDLTNKNMHWWTFYKLLNGLSNSEMGNCCILNRVRNLRNYDTRKIKDPKELEKIRKAKQLVALKSQEKKPTREQSENAERFWKSMGYGKEEQ